MDAFAVSITVGLNLERLTARHIFRLAFHFGLFQFMMPILGWWAGSTVSQWITAVDHWLAFGLLGFIGGKMIRDSFLGEDERRKPRDPTRGWMLITLSVATSIDALAVGLSMAFLGVSVWLPSIIIGTVAGLMTVIGIVFGRRAGAPLGVWAERVGGLLLVCIGLRILVSHLV